MFDGVVEVLYVQREFWVISVRFYCVVDFVVFFLLLDCLLEQLILFTAPFFLCALIIWKASTLGQRLEGVVLLNQCIGTMFSWFGSLGGQDWVYRCVGGGLSRLFLSFWSALK